MEFSIKSGKSEKQRNDCVIVGVYESGKLSHSAKSIDDASEGYLAKVLKRGDMDGKLASTLLLQDVAGAHAERVLLVGLGKHGELSEKSYHKAVMASVSALSKTGANDVASFLAEVDVLNADDKKQDAAWKVAQMVEAVNDALYLSLIHI
jgi:leucyl aminopeptidase